MTNKEKYFPGIRLTDEELAILCVCPGDIIGKKIPCGDKRCIECTADWFRAECDELTEEPKKAKVPSQIDRPNFERQLESYSIKAFVQQLKYFACKINEVLEYLEETK